MTDQIKAILVDDEEGSRDVLGSLLKRFCPGVALVDKCSNVQEAVLAINEHHPHLVFLDIEMPDYAGHEILDFFERIDFEIIFVTAYDSYAIKAFEVAAVDYLLKPINIDRLKEAVRKVQVKRASSSMAEHYQVLRESLESDRIRKLVVTDKGDHVVVPVEEIIAIEAQESYSRIRTARKTYVASKNLKHFELLLAHNPNFFRSHKSWIVNLDKLLKYNKSSGDIMMNEGICAKLSKYRKEDFEALLAGS